MQDILTKTLELCKNKGRLLYLSTFGSNLYGTNINGKSDIDVKGIFLPDIKDLIFQNPINNIHYSTGNDKSKNNSSDVDIDLWSLQYWLQRLLPISDTGAIDLLFSYTNKDAVLYMNPNMKDIFEHPLEFVDTTNTKTCVNYSLGQAKKYGIKGSRLGILKKILEVAKNNYKFYFEKLENHYEKIIDACNDSKYCTYQEMNGQKLLFVCGKYHNLNIKMDEFIKRITKEYESYGNRAEVAEKNGGIDWKALSHAVRAIFQTQELLETGNIVFPLKRKEEIVRIKTGCYDWQTTENVILSELDKLETIFQKSEFKSKQNELLAKQIILDFYL